MLLLKIGLGENVINTKETPMIINREPVICSNDRTHQNPADALFCNKCGKRLAKEKVNSQNFCYGVFAKGGHGNGYTIAFDLEPSMSKALHMQNKMMHSLYQPEIEYFLGEVRELVLLPEDADNFITNRLTVLRWWQLVWDGHGGWFVAEELAEKPELIILSGLE